MKWTNRKLMIVTYLLAPIFPIWLIAQTFLDWRDEKWKYEKT